MLPVMYHNGTVSGSISTFPALSSAQFTVVVQNDAGTTEGTSFTNIVTISSDNDPNSENDQAVCGTFICQPPSSTISGSSAVCSGGTATLTFAASGTGSVTINYTNSAGQSGSVIVQGDNIPVIKSVITPTLAGTYTYTITGATNSVGCNGLGTGIGSVTVNAIPSAILSPSSQLVCGGTSTNVIVTFNAAGTYSFTYAVYNGVATSTTTVPTTTGSTYTITTGPLLTGTYTYTVLSIQNNGTGCTTTVPSNSATVIAKPLPTATITPALQTVCQNGTPPSQWNRTIYVYLYIKWCNKDCYNNWW